MYRLYPFVVPVIIGIAMGLVCFLGFSVGMSDDLYHAVNKWMGHFKGGLAMVIVAAVLPIFKMVQNVPTILK